MYLAKLGKITPEMQKILEKEKVSKKFLLKNIAKGKIAIIPNRNNENHIAIGDGLRSKFICNIGTSSDNSDTKLIFKMVKIANDLEIDLLCDLSTGKNFASSRKVVIKEAKMPIASIPLYQAAIESKEKHGNFYSFTPKELIKTFENQVKEGITAPGIHIITKELVKVIENSKRYIPISSRGGKILYHYIKKNNSENPYIEYFDEILTICNEYDVPLTFICSSRAGCLADGLDKIQLTEWRIIKTLIKRAHSRYVSVIINGIGHLRMDLIPKAVLKMKKITNNIPIGVMGPAITDRALGFEHIAHAIGASIAIQYGANYCQSCCRTEHIGLPNLEDFKESIYTYKIAINGADLTKFQYLQNPENEMAKARYNLEWGKQINLAINQEIAKETFKRVGPKNPKALGCSICGELCLYHKIKN
ncbi:MAG: phosphomethylpyrimidine synthase ThiC [Promethearchaeota archaeon]